MKLRLPFLLFFLSTSVFAQLPGANDTSFNTMDPGYSNGLGPDAQVRAVAIQNDGKVIIGGYFTQFNDGVLDTGFNVGSGFNDYVQCIAIQSDGKIVVGGNFTSYNGITRNRIARLNTDGSLDLSFNPNSGANLLVRSIAIQSDGKIVIAGNFTNYSSTSRNRIARLNTNGTLDNSYNPGTGFNSSVYGIDIRPDDKIVAVGAFTLFNGVVRERMARLKTNGSLDSSFLPGFGFDNTVYSLALMNNGNIVAGGDFGYFSGIVRNKVAMVDANGSLITTFNPGGGFNSVVYALHAQVDGKVLAGGSFSTYKGNSTNKIIRLDSIGNKDTTFITGTGFGSSGGFVVYSIQTYPDGRIVTGGEFSEYDGISRNRIVRLFPDGKVDLSLNMYTGFNGTVKSIVVQQDGKILVGGDFRVVNGVVYSGIARLHRDGSLDPTFKTGTGINYNVAYTGVHALLIQPDGKIIVGGNFFDYNGNSARGLMRLYPNGTLDTSFNAGTGVGAGAIYQMVLQNDGKIIIGGSFNSYDGVNTNKIARINTDGTRDISFQTGTFPNAGFNQDVKALALQPDGKLLVGGGFSKYKTTFVSNRILRIKPDGDLDTSFLQNNGFNGVIEAIGLQADGKIVVGGTFTMFNTTARNRIARVEANGNLDPTFYPGSNGFFGNVTELIVQGDSQIVAAGTFTTYNLINHKRIIRLNPNGTVDNSINFGTGFTDDVETLALQSDGKILAGGAFTAFESYGRNRITRINNNCVPNLKVLNTVACDSFQLNNQTYDSSGTYMQKFTNVHGCDSSLIVNLTINKAVSSSLNVSACDTFTLNGQGYVNSGTYTQILSSTVGCDSTITLNLIITNSTSGTITTNACKSYQLNGQTYTSTGTYLQTLTNGAGCDSIVTLNLTVINLDTSVAKIGNNTLEANEVAATYQWLDCDNTANPLIAGATSKTFTPAKDGRYAVRITKNGCTETSGCHFIKKVGLKENFSSTVSLYPNPAGSTVMLYSNIPLTNSTIRLMTIEGKLIVEEKEITGSSYLIDLQGYSKGIYIVEVNEENTVLRMRLVKE